jgi:hypothetical protein
MRLLFNLEVLEDNRVRARPSDYLQSLPRDRQLNEVKEFLQWAEATVADSATEPRARAEAEIGLATAREFLAKLQQAQTPVYTGRDE